MQTPVLKHLETSFEIHWNQFEKRDLMIGRSESLVPESFKHFICSRIRVSTAACRMAVHDMPQPPSCRSGKLPIAYRWKQKQNRGYTPGFN